MDLSSVCQQTGASGTHSNAYTDGNGDTYADRNVYFDSNLDIYANWDTYCDADQHVFANTNHNIYAIALSYFDSHFYTIAFCHANDNIFTTGRRNTEQ